MSKIKDKMTCTITPIIVDACDRLWSLTSILEKNGLNISNYREIICQLAIDFSERKAFNLFIKMYNELKINSEEIYKKFIEIQDEFVNDGFINKIEIVTLIV
jgi:ATP-dependent protease HslVU (ClpYQ) peptidase subunit